MRHQNVSLTLAIVADCRRKQGGKNWGSSQLTVWQWLTHVECKLTSRTTNSKKGTKRYQQLFKTSGEGRKGTDQQPTLSGPFFYDDVGVAYKSMWVWFRAHAHKNNIH